MVKRVQTILCACLILILCLSGCGIEQADSNKVKDIDFTVVEDSEVPEDLKLIIEEKQTDNFKITFTTDKYLYIAIGYGEQSTNGYSIAVEELYLTSNAVYIKTNLIGPAKGDVVSDVKSYPYVVVKIESIDKNVVFE